jgi:hypothetical protein
MALVLSIRDVTCNSPGQILFTKWYGNSICWYLDSLAREDGADSCTETSKNYQHTLLNIPEKRGPQMHHEWSLKSRKTLGPSQCNELPIMT